MLPIGWILGILGVNYICRLHKKCNELNNENHYLKLTI